MRFPPCLIFVLLALLLPAQAQEPKLRVGIFEKPPFAMKDGTGAWSGLAVMVWEKISADLALPFEYVEVTPERAIADTAAGRLDLVIGEVGVSSGRARLVKFSQPYAVFPAAVALEKSRRFPHWLDFLDDVLKHGVASIFLIMLGAMVAFSLMLWLVERRGNAAHFGGHPVRGFGSALWFAAVTMTTVGYGDKTPRTVAGRIVVFFWMFLGVVVISVFTGTVASSLAVARMETSINSASALARYQNGVEDGSTAQNVLSETGVPARLFPGAVEGLQALEGGKITAFVGSEATLRYLVNRRFAGKLVVEIIPGTHMSYAFAMRPGLRERDAIDVSLIEQVSRPGWRQEMQRIIGPTGL